jgi:CheY-like chemotaxis protein
MWKAWLAYWGFAVEEASNGAEALLKARAWRPDLVLMDLWMPVLDGFSATAQLKSDPNMAGVPVLALSAHVTTPGPEQARHAGCDAFLPKPVDPDELLAHVRQAFRLRRERGLTGERGVSGDRGGVRNHEAEPRNRGDRGQP